MPVDRNFWTRYWFTENDTPLWTCPTCLKGTLSLLKASLFEKERIQSLRSHDDDWVHYQYDGIFSCILICKNEVCGEQVAVSGRSASGDGQYGQPVVKLIPLMFTPPLQLLTIPKECPHDVAKEFASAFDLFWADIPGGMNHIRKATELILDHLGIPRRFKTKSNKLKRMQLHARIERYRPKNPVLAKRLEAIKWLGNEGSHTDEVTQDAYFDACDLLEAFIHAHFEKREKRIDALADKINKRKGSR